ncbi:hypothetical protein LR69_01531 [Geobacillus sp. BCO2]|nr:hypothetical protein LR69_01531 [Geobacillus sp. BCO2]
MQLPVGHMWKHDGLNEQKWMEMVQTYTPEQADEWKKVLDERNALRQQLNDENVKQAIKEKVQKDEKRA